MAAFLFYSLNMMYISDTTARIQGSGMGLAGFATMLFSMLSFMRFLNAFPYRKKPNVPMLVLLFVMLAIVIFAEGRAIIRKVGVFLMDEPLSNLDAKQRVTMRSEIAQIHRETGATTIYVTHDQTEAMTLADRIVVMKDGYVQQIGTPYELYHDPINVFVAGFIGEPPMNFIRGTVKGGKIPFGTNTLDIAPLLDGKAGQYEGREIVFGFRPEAIELGAQDGAYQINAQVELTEMLGDNVNVYITTGEDKAILKADPHNTPEIDSTLTFSIPFGDVYLFDGETENVIARAEKAAAV